jgi:hypothetical protein
MGEHACEKRPLLASDVNAFRASLGTIHTSAVEVGAPNGEFNCHGFSVVHSHGFFFDPTPFLTDDHVEVSFGHPLVGDVIVYHNGALLTHTGLVIEVNQNQITRVRSKWGRMGLVEHGPSDVPPSYGSPRRLFRRNQAQALGPLDLLLGELALMNEEEIQAVVDGAVAGFSDPSEQYKVMLASSPDVAKLIIEALPGVQELLALGPEVAGRVALDLLRKEETQENEALSGIALYILQRASSEETVTELASAVRENKFSGINLHLAADALLSASKFESLAGDPVVAAKALAEDLK